MSLHILQATILIAVHGIGHCIYPAGYLTVGHCARIGIMFGLHDLKNATQLFKDPDTWTLREEERRTWWAVLLLDRSVEIQKRRAYVNNLRFIQAGTNCLPLVAKEPLESDLLPCDDSSWNQGIIGSNEPLFDSSPGFSSTGSDFASVCRAVHLFGRVTRHRDDHNFEIFHRLSEVFQLHRALLALESTFQVPNVSDDEQYLSRAICYDARLILYNIYACNERYGEYRHGQETDMQEVSIEGIMEVAFSVSEMAHYLINEFPTRMESIIPLIINCLFHALTECAWVFREDRNVEMKAAMDTICMTIKLLNDRWRVCGE